MDHFVFGSASQPCGNDIAMQIALAEAAAQLETLRVLGNAIQQHRRLLEGRYDYVARIEMAIPMR
jgi:hypothetical protein